MPNSFIIFCAPRTGSYHLVGLLNSCHDVSCHGELFKGKTMELRKELKDKISITDFRIRDAQANRFLSEVKSHYPGQHFGFKAFPSHFITAPKIRRLLNDWKTVILFREPLAAYASNERATMTNIWMIKGGNNPERRNQKIRFTPASFDKQMKFYMNFINQCAELAKDSRRIVVPYHKLNAPEMQQQLLGFIGSSEPVDNLQSGYQKQFTAPLLDGFENPEELKKYVRSSRIFEENRTIVEFLQAHGEYLEL